MLLLLAVATGAFPSVAGAQSAADSVAITATALDYIEGWYEADAARMERALHPRLAKRFLESIPNAGVRLTETSALELVQQVRAGGGSSVPRERRRTDVRILDIFQNVASVRVDAHGWIDYMHIARANGEWRIVNVLWEIRAESNGLDGATLGDDRDGAARDDDRDGAARDDDPVGATRDDDPDVRAEHDRADRERTIVSRADVGMARPPRSGPG